MFSARRSQLSIAGRRRASTRGPRRRRAECSNLNRWSIGRFLRIWTSPPGLANKPRSIRSSSRRTTCRMSTPPGTQQFSQNDGAAYSNLTFTSAASTTGSPGVNLDVLARQNVNKNGIASVGLNAGLADTSGTIGSSIPITIMATSASENKGDPVNVQFSFTFNVESFGNNNATATFTYAPVIRTWGRRPPLPPATTHSEGRDHAGWTRPDGS